MRTYVYIDGLNLYYRALRNTRWKWLDLLSLCEQALQPHHRILKIKYFTTRALRTPRDPQKPNRQDSYLHALQHHHPEKIEIHLGRFLAKPTWYPLAGPAENRQVVKVIRMEEKETDVNLAVHLLNDAWKDRYDCAVLVTNDGDMAEAMRLTKSEHPEKQLGLISPNQKHHSTQLRQHTDFFMRLKSRWLHGSQLPDPIPGTNFRKPSSW